MVPLAAGPNTVPECNGRLRTPRLNQIQQLEVKSSTDGIIAGSNPTEWGLHRPWLCPSPLGCRTPCHTPRRTTFTGTQLQRFNGHTGAVSSFSVSTDRLYAVSGSEDNSVRFWTVASGARRGTSVGGPRPVAAISSQGWAAGGPIPVPAGGGGNSARQKGC